MSFATSLQPSLLGSPPNCLALHHFNHLPLPSTPNTKPNKPHSPKPPVKQTAHQGQHIREERDDLRDEERDHPRHGDDRDPGAPADERVRVPVLRVAEDAEEDEAGGDGLGEGQIDVSSTL